MSYSHFNHLRGPMDYLDLRTLAQDDSLAESIEDLYDAANQGEITHAEWRLHLLELADRLDETTPAVLGVIARLERKRIETDLSIAFQTGAINPVEFSHLTGEEQYRVFREWREKQRQRGMN